MVNEENVNKIIETKFFLEEVIKQVNNKDEYGYESYKAFIDVLVKQLKDFAISKNLDENYYQGFTNTNVVFINTNSDFINTNLDFTDEL